MLDIIKEYIENDVNSLDEAFNKMEKTEKVVIKLHKRDEFKNSEGYSDPTPGKVIQKETEEEKRFHELLHTIKYITNNAGFKIENRIVLTDLMTGREWR